ncbi:hypothetical protein V6N13_130317 [Hibiscus sabdariffa]
MLDYSLSATTPNIYLNCSKAVFQCGNISIGYPFYGGSRIRQCGHSDEVEETHLNDTENADENADKNVDMEQTVLFEFDTLIQVTDNFSPHNKLGRGGFGTVYKAWRLWKEGNPSGIVDEFSVVEAGDLPELLRYIHIGLLWVQQRPEERPSMAFVTFMLESSLELPLPRLPDFLLCDNSFERNSSLGNAGSSSTNLQ